MNDEHLKLILPQFVAIFLIIAFWRSYQYKIVLSNHEEKGHSLSNKIKRLDHCFSILLILFSIMTVLYAYYPHLYRLFMPIDKFNEPTINSIGVFLLRLSLAWVVVGQLLVKRAVDRFSRLKDGNPVFILRAKKTCLLGILFMFFGMIITITNVIGIILCNLAFLLFRKHEQRRIKL